MLTKFCLLDGNRIEVALCVKSQSYFFINKIYLNGVEDEGLAPPFLVFR